MKAPERKKCLEKGQKQKRRQSRPDRRGSSLYQKHNWNQSGSKIEEKALWIKDRRGSSLDQKHNWNQSGSKAVEEAVWMKDGRGIERE